MKKALRLRRETLAALTDEQLVGVAGAGTHPPFLCTATCWNCMSLDQCPTVPVRECRLDPA